MKIILIGNAGAGKSTLTQKLLEREAAACLSLDQVAFSEGAKRRPLSESVAAVQSFMREHTSWIIEGCYADIIEPIIGECEQLIFLNPGIEVCEQHCRKRPWEPDKFASEQEQDANLDNLIEWVRSYETRTDEYGCQRHCALFNAFGGHKVELKNPSRYIADIS